MSVIFYKFKSAKDYDKHVFDGSSISVFELKREIIIAKNLGNGVDFDLVMFNAQTSEEYKDDSQMILRNTSVLVSRRPAVAPVKGTARRYLASVVPFEVMSTCPSQYHSPAGAAAPRSPGSPDGSKNEHPVGSINPFYQASAPGTPVTDPMKSAQKPEGCEAAAPVMEGVTEEERIDNMFKQQARQWKTSQRMSQQKLPMKPKRRPANRTINVNHSMNSAGSGDAMYDKAEFSTRIGSMMRETDGAVSKSIIDAAGDRQIPTGMDGGPWMDGRKMNQRAPPPGYICYRCGRKGHFISNCPTIGDKDFDRPRLKRTTGIPKIFLKAVEDPQSSRSGVMIAQTGELVIAQPNDFEWKKLYVKTKNSLVPGNIYELAEKDSLPEYKCSICERLCRDPVSTSCCGKSYCYECINNALVNNEDESKRLICPGCSRSQAPENLMPRDDIQSGIENLLREFLLKQNSVEREQAEKDQLSESDASSVKPSSVDLSNGNFKDGRLDRNGPAGDSGDSSGPTTKTVLNTFQHYALPRRKHVSKPFTIISDLQPSESNLNEKQDLVRTGNEDSECNEVDGSSQEKSEDIEPRVCIPNRPKSSASPFTVMPAGADSASQNEDCSNPNAAVTYSGSFSDTSVKPPETVGTHIVSLASRKRQNPIKIVREAAATGSQQGETQLPPLDSNAPLNSANTGVSNRPQLEAPLFASDSADSSGATQNKRPRLSTDVSSGAAGVAVYQIPGYESSTSLRPLEDVPSAQVLQSSSRPIPTKSSKNPSIPRGKRHASRDFMHGYNPNRNCAVAHQGNDAYINTPRSSPTSTIPILPREFSGSPYDVRFTKPQFHHVSDSKLQDVQLANHVRLRPMSHDIFTTVFSPHSGIPLFNASSDLVLGPTSNSYVRRRFAPKGDA